MKQTTNNKGTWFSHGLSQYVSSLDLCLLSKIFLTCNHWRQREAGHNLVVIKTIMFLSDLVRNISGSYFIFANFMSMLAEHVISQLCTVWSKSEYVISSKLMESRTEGGRGESFIIMIKISPPAGWCPVSLNDDLNTRKSKTLNRATPTC